MYSERLMENWKQVISSGNVIETQSYWTLYHTYYLFMSGQCPTHWDPLEKVIYSIAIQSHALVIYILPYLHLPMASSLLFSIAKFIRIISPLTTDMLSLHLHL